MGGKFDGIAIVSDMDGTYIAGNADGDRRNREAIEYFKANGGHFTFATGRPLPTLLVAAPDAAEITNLPVICCNGAYLYDLKADREIASFSMDYEEVYELQRNFAKLEAGKEECKNAANDHKSVFFKHKKNIEGAIDKYRCEHIKEDLYEIMPPEEWKDHDIHKAIFVGDGEAVTNTRKYLDPLFEDRLCISQASPNYYEFNANGVSKASSIQKMLKLIFGDRKMTLCVAGDFDNDLEMLKSADRAYCPENANDRVKAVCHKCFCHCKNGVIADIIEYLDRELGE
ncbi:MAG: HAD-IIB family hydrolase [Clostridia bacterium]|nr:HAD-IIB family hydrolase [Clostridia bacterium]